MTEIESSRSELVGVRNIERRTWNASSEIRHPWNVNFVSVAVHPGGINTVWPLTEKLIGKGAKTTLVTGDVATDIIHSSDFPKASQIQKGLPGNGLFDQNGVNLIVVSDSTGPEMNLEKEVTLQAILHKSEFGKTIICFIEDGTSGLKPNMSALEAKGVNLGQEIDAFFMAERGSRYVYKEFSEIPDDKFITTGATEWDILRTEHTEKENNFLRNKMGIEQGAIVISHYAGRGHGLWSEMEHDATPAVVQAVVNLAQSRPDKNIVLLYRFHPGDSQPEILGRLLMQNIPPRVPRNLKIKISRPEQSRTEDGRLVSAIADVATGAYSDSLTGVALRGARRSNYNRTGQMPLYFLSPVVREQLARSHYPLSSAVMEGAAIFADSPEELSAVMEKAIFSNEVRQYVFARQAAELRERYRFKGSDTATDRAFLQIRKLLKDLNSK